LSGLGGSAVQKGALALAGAGAALLLAGLVTGSPSLAKPGAAVAACCLAIGLGAAPALRGYRFTAWIVAAVVCAMLYPERFSRLGPLELRDPWIILAVVQIVMFGMGTQMSLRDLAGVLEMPGGVLVGLVGKLGTVGLAAAIFSPWMNVSGSVLANHWRRRPADPGVAAGTGPTPPARREGRPETGGAREECEQ